MTEGWNWLESIWDLQREGAELVFTIAWLLCYERNSMVHGKSLWFVSGNMVMAEQFLAEFKAANMLTAQTRESCNISYFYLT